MLGVVAERFVRTQWKDVQTLAQELYAIFREPLDIQPGSIKIVQPAGATTPPIQVTQPAANTGPGISISNGGTTITLGPVGGSGGGSGGGGINLGSVTFPGQDPGDVAQAVPAPNENPIVLHGKIVAKIAGTVYQVRCWAKNPDTAPPIGLLAVDFKDADPDESLPANATCPVIAFPGADGTVFTILKATGYFPVWYPEAS